MNMERLTAKDLQRMFEEVFKPEKVILKKMGATSFQYTSPAIKLTLGIGAARELEKVAKENNIKIEYI
jgi:hypothetical protein